MKSRVINPAEARIIEEHLENGMLKLLCQVMRVAGLRVSDACGLKYNDINDNVLFVVEQKTGKSKRVVLPSDYGKDDIQEVKTYTYALDEFMRGPSWLI